MHNFWCAVGVIVFCLLPHRFIPLLSFPADISHTVTLPNGYLFATPLPPFPTDISHTQRRVPSKRTWRVKAIAIRRNDDRLID